MIAHVRFIAPSCSPTLLFSRSRVFAAIGCNGLLGSLQNRERKLYNGTEATMAARHGYRHGFLLALAPLENMDEISLLPKIEAIERITYSNPEMGFVPAPA